MPLPRENIYTIDDIYALPEGQRAELIDGELYMMAPPGRTHQQILSWLHGNIFAHIKAYGGDCEVYPAPFTVFLNDDAKYLEPDISVICEKDKLDDKGCHGAPDQGGFYVRQPDFPAGRFRARKNQLPGVDSWPVFAM